MNCNLDGAVIRSTPWRRSLAMAFGLCVTAITHASPTSEDYVPCHQQAGLTLSECMNQKAPSDHEVCWQSARKAKNSCYAKVNASYSPMSERKREAKAKSDAEMRRNEALGGKIPLPP